MKVGIVGLGCVGTVTGGCISRLGHDVVGYDIDPAKVDLFASGRAPIAEPHIDQVLHDAWRAGRVAGATTLENLVDRTELTFICVGTGIHPGGAQSITALEDVAERIGEAIALKRQYHSVVVRTTVLPGTTRERILPILQRAAAGAVGERFGLAVNPEFMREGSAIADFDKPPRTVIGEMDAATGDKLVSLYAGLKSPVFRASVEIAEAVKYADNSWHALKVAFVNEIASICQASNLDSRAVMDIFCADDVLNISRAYLQPGFAFGGPCLPKDVAALAHHGTAKGLELPVLSHILASNERLIEEGVDRILQTGHARIGLLGLTYKAGVGDLRGSPFVELASRLRAAGRTVRAFDPNVSRARTVAAQRDYTDKVTANLDELLAENLDQLLAWAETVVFTTAAPEYTVAFERLRPEHAVIDFANVRGSTARAAAVKA